MPRRSNASSMNTKTTRVVTPTAGFSPTQEDGLVIGPRQRVSDEAYRRLYDAIVTGYFEPGMRLLERDLTSRLQVSRTPIREALQRLEKDRLIVFTPHCGYYVRNPTLEEARQAYEMRGIIEAACGEFAARRASPEQIAAMRQAVERGDELVRENDFANLLLANNAFHYLQARATHNAFLEEQWRVVWAYVDLLRGRIWMHTHRPSTGQEEHHAIIDAIERHDIALARRLNQEHVQQAWKTVADRFLIDRRASDEPDAVPTTDEL